MATAYASEPAAAARSGWRSDQRFFLRFSIALLLFVVVGFAQWSLRGFVDFGAVPVWVHFHGAAMLSWFTLFAVQNWLADSGSIALHRRLGWLGLGLLVVVIPLAIFTATKSVELHRVPPFFTNGYFLALSTVGWPIVAALAGTAIVKRRDTEWHRRLMLSAFILLIEPALGRLLPMPLFGPAGPWIETLCQLGVLSVAMVHDRRVRGAVHPALWWGAAALLTMRLAVDALAGFGPWVAFADSLAAG